MECPFSPNQNDFGYWISSNGQKEDLIACDSNSVNLISEDPVNSFTELMKFDESEDHVNSFTELMKFDDSDEWGNSSIITDQIFASFELPPAPPLPYASFDALNIMDQTPSLISDEGGTLNDRGVAYNFGEEIVLPQARVETDYPDDLTNSNDLVSKSIEDGYIEKVIDNSDLSICKTVPPTLHTLNERMLKALSILKEASGEGILAQIWVPIKHEDQYRLSTADQPYLLDSMLSGYREVSRTYTFSSEVKPNSFLGVPGRVYVSKVPEWTSDLTYYKKTEYLRATHAIEHDVHGSIAVPIFESHRMSCCAVLELVTTNARSNFDIEMENVCNALQAVDLNTSTSPRRPHQSISRNQRAALSEIYDVLRAVCKAHKLPLALTWIPCTFKEDDDEVIEVRVKEGNRTTNEKCILCIETSSCYVNDRGMEGFVHACNEHYLEEGQGVVGKALQSNHPFFFPDVKMQDINDYPLVHHTRKFGLNAAVAVKLRSTHTDDDDYILEFFLPVNMTCGSKQQLLLKNLADTMQRICKSLRIVSNAELAHIEGSKLDRETIPNLPDKGSPSNTCGDLNSIHMKTFNKEKEKVDGSPKLARSGSRKCPIEKKPIEKKKNTTEKTVSFSVLQQYFCGSLRDASKALHISPTTLKRICRSKKIKRWPSRKLKKIRRLMKKAQSDMDSIPGVDGTIKFELVMSGLVVSCSMKQERETPISFQFREKSPDVQNFGTSTYDGASMLPNDLQRSTFNLEDDDFTVEKNLKAIMKCKSKSIRNSLVEDIDNMVECGEASKMVAINTNHLKVDKIGNDTPANRYMNSIKFENSKSPFVSGQPALLPTLKELVTGMENAHDQPNTSSMTDSTHSSGSLMSGSATSSSIFLEEINVKVPPKNFDADLRLTVKAIYKEDIIRFKFNPSVGCFHLYEEVARRLKLQNGTFQLKYLDDEEEWVMLVSEADLQECVEMLNSTGISNVKFLVRDIPNDVGSSDHSNCFLY